MQCFASPLTCCSSSPVNWRSASCRGWWSPPWQPLSLLQMLWYPLCPPPLLQAVLLVRLGTMLPLMTDWVTVLQGDINCVCLSLSAVWYSVWALWKCCLLSSHEQLQPTQSRLLLFLLALISLSLLADYTGLSGCFFFPFFFRKKKQRLECVRGGWAGEAVWDPVCVTVPFRERGWKYCSRMKESLLLSVGRIPHVRSRGRMMEGNVGGASISYNLTCWAEYLLWSLTIFPANTQFLRDNSPSDAHIPWSYQCSSPTWDTWKN